MYNTLKLYNQPMHSVCGKAILSYYAPWTHAKLIRWLSLTIPHFDKFKKKTIRPRVCFKTVEQYHEYLIFQATSNNMFGSVLKDKSKVKIKDKSEIDSFLDLCEDAKYYNKFSEEQFLPLPESRSINKGKSIPVFKKTFTYEISNPKNKLERKSETLVKETDDFFSEAQLEAINDELNKQFKDNIDKVECSESVTIFNPKELTKNKANDGNVELNKQFKHNIDNVECTESVSMFNSKERTKNKANDDNVELNGQITDNTAEVECSESVTLFSFIKDLVNKAGILDNVESNEPLLCTVNGQDCSENITKLKLGGTSNKEEKDCNSHKIKHSEGTTILQMAQNENCDYELKNAKTTKVTSKEKNTSETRLLESSLKTILSYPLCREQENKKELPFTKYLEPHVSALPREPSVGNILNETMSAKSKAALDRWKKKKIRELGEEGFQKLKQDLFRTGGNFHQCVADHLEKKPELNLLPENEPLWESISPVFEDIDEVELIETTVTHSKLGYMGILDSVARYRGELVLIDWKTSQRQKKTLDAAYDDPVQIMAYMGAVNDDPNFGIQINRGLLVVAYRDGRPADVLSIPLPLCHMYWKQWLSRLHQYWKARL